MTFHFYSWFEQRDHDSQRRMEIASKTWGSQEWDHRPIDDSFLPRMFEEPPRKLPYLKDLFKIACSKYSDNDIGVFTNSDICVVTDCAKRIEEHLNDGRDACYAFRNDFGRIDSPLSDEQVKHGYKYCGADLFAFRVKWWREHGSKFPDMVLGREAWDACMRVLMEATKPDKSKSLALPDLIYHEKHPNGWESPNIRYRIAGQLYNLRLAYPWLKKMGQNPHGFGIRNV